MVDKGGHTVSVTRFAELTGVSRERLRTWERRYGFPAPVRHAGGPRRYLLDDAPRVVAVRQRAEEGVPLERAIAESEAPPPPRPDGATFAATVDRAPGALVLLGGPEPVRLEWANAVVRGAAGAPALGALLADALPWYPDSDFAGHVQRLFTSDQERAECRHPAWSGAPGELGHAVLWRVPAAPDRPPLVAAMDVERARDRRRDSELAELRAVADRLTARAERQARWMDLATALAEGFRTAAAADLLTHVSDTLVRRLNAVDAGVCLYMGGELAVGGSSRGLLGPRMVTVTAHEDLAAALRGDEPAWLDASTAAAFGAPAELALAVAPVLVLGETLGVIVIAFAEREEIDLDVRQLMSVVATGVGFAILRDRLVAGARTMQAEA